MTSYPILSVVHLLKMAPAMKAMKKAGGKNKTKVEQKPQGGAKVLTRAKKDRRCRVKTKVEQTPQGGAKALTRNEARRGKRAVESKTRTRNRDKTHRKLHETPKRKSRSNKDAMVIAKLQQELVELTPKKDDLDMQVLKNERLGELLADKDSELNIMHEARLRQTNLYMELMERYTRRNGLKITRPEEIPF